MLGVHSRGMADVQHIAVLTAELGTVRLQLATCKGELEEARRGLRDKDNQWSSLLAEVDYYKRELERVSEELALLGTAAAAAAAGAVPAPPTPTAVQQLEGMLLSSARGAGESAAVSMAGYGNGAVAGVADKLGTTTVGTYTQEAWRLRLDHMRDERDSALQELRVARQQLLSQERDHQEQLQLHAAMHKQLQHQLQQVQEMLQEEGARYEGARSRLIKLLHVVVSTESNLRRAYAAMSAAKAGPSEAVATGRGLRSLPGSLQGGRSDGGSAALLSASGAAETVASALAQVVAAEEDLRDAALLGLDALAKRLERRVGSVLILAVEAHNALQSCQAEHGETSRRLDELLSQLRALDSSRADAAAAVAVAAAAVGAARPGLAVSGAGTASLFTAGRGSGDNSTALGSQQEGRTGSWDGGLVQGSSLTYTPRLGGLSTTALAGTSLQPASQLYSPRTPVVPLDTTTSYTSSYHASNEGGAAPGSRSERGAGAPGASPGAWGTPSPAGSAVSASWVRDPRDLAAVSMLTGPVSNGGLRIQGGREGSLAAGSSWARPLLPSGQTQALGSVLGNAGGDPNKSVLQYVPPHGRPRPFIPATQSRMLG